MLFYLGSNNYYLIIFKYIPNSIRFKRAREINGDIYRSETIIDFVSLRDHPPSRQSFTLPAGSYSSLVS